MNKKFLLKLNLYFLVLIICSLILNYSVNAENLDDTLRNILIQRQKNKHNTVNNIKYDSEKIKELLSKKQETLNSKLKSEIKVINNFQSVNTDNQKLTLEELISAQSFIVLDSNTNKILYSKSPFKRMAPASLTKIITAIITIDSDRNLDELITIKRNINIRSDGISLGLKAGDKTTLRDLLYMALLYSANDACVAIAEEIAGSVQEFAKLMNLYVKELGAINSNFVNPNGMPDERHYSTAYDLALISSYAMKNPTFAQIVSTKKHSVKLITYKEIKPNVKNKSKNNKNIKNNTKGESKIVEVTRVINLTNRHKLLGKVEGVKGIKTGYTKAAGRCLATAYSDLDKNLIIVVLKSKDVNADTLSLIDYTKNHNVNFAIKTSNPESPINNSFKTSLSTINIIK